MLNSSTATAGTLNLSALAPAMPPDSNASASSGVPPRGGQGTYALSESPLTLNRDSVQFNDSRKAHGDALLSRDDFKKALANDARRIKNSDTFNKIIGATVVLGFLAAAAIVVGSICQYKGVFDKNSSGIKYLSAKTQAHAPKSSAQCAPKLQSKLALTSHSHPLRKPQVNSKPESQAHAVMTLWPRPAMKQQIAAAICSACGSAHRSAHRSAPSASSLELGVAHVH